MLPNIVRYGLLQPGDASELKVFLFFSQLLHKTTGKKQEDLLDIVAVADEKKTTEKLRSLSMLKHSRQQISGQRWLLL